MRKREREREGDMERARIEREIYWDKERVKR